MSVTVKRSHVGKTYNSTPAAMVLRVEAGIAVLKSPAVGEQVSWIALSIMWYVGLVKKEESLLIINWPDHDMTKDHDFNNVENQVAKCS